jgi:hypothetical protein
MPRQLTTAAIDPREEFYITAPEALALDGIAAMDTLKCQPVANSTKGPPL